MMTWEFALKSIHLHLLLTADVCFSLASRSLTAAWLRHSSTCLLSSVSSRPTNSKLLPQTGHRGTTATSLPDSLLASSAISWDCEPVDSDVVDVLLAASSANVDVLLLSVQRRLSMDTMVAESCPPAAAVPSSHLTQNSYIIHPT